MFVPEMCRDSLQKRQGFLCQQECAHRAFSWSTLRNIHVQACNSSLTLYTTEARIMCDACLHLLDWESWERESAAVLVQVTSTPLHSVASLMSREDSWPLTTEATVWGGSTITERGNNSIPYLTIAEMEPSPVLSSGWNRTSGKSITATVFSLVNRTKIFKVW